MVYMNTQTQRNISGRLLLLEAVYKSFGYLQDENHNPNTVQFRKVIDLNNDSFYVEEHTLTAFEGLNIFQVAHDADMFFYEDSQHNFFLRQRVIRKIVSKLDFEDAVQEQQLIEFFDSLKSTDLYKTFQVDDTDADIGQLLLTLYDPHDAAEPIENFSAHSLWQNDKALLALTQSVF